MEQRIQLLGLHPHHSLLLRDHALVHQVHSHLQSGGGGALAVSGLEHIELAIFNGELHILHILIVILQLVGNGSELLIHLGHVLLELFDLEGGADTGHHVLALGVDQVFAEELLLAGGGVAGKCHAGAGILVQVAKHHGHDVDGSAPGVGDVVHAAVVIGPGVVPGAEDGLDGLHHLDFGIGGELLALFLLVELFEEGHQLLHVVLVQVDVILHTLGSLHLVDDDFKALLGQLHHHVGEHLDEPAVGVVDKALELVGGIAGDEAGGHFVVHAQVQDGVHHAGHGGPGAGADGDQQGLLGVAELFIVDLLNFCQSLVDLAHDLIIDGPAILVILGAGFRRDGEALRHRHTQAGHFRQVCTLAAEQLPHGAVALGEQVDILMRQSFYPFRFSDGSRRLLGILFA